MISKMFGGARLGGAFVIAGALAIGAPGQAAAPCGAAEAYPTEHWQPAYDAALGWDEDRLTSAWSKAQHAHYTGGMLVYRGVMIGRFGDVSTPFQTRSIRKSLLNAVIGQLVAERKIALGDTLAKLRIDDRPPLTQQEKQATVRDLLMSRSGVYHDAAYALPDDERPPRGAFRPGQHFWYNNWDFNVLGVIAEKAGGASLFRQFEQRVARPLQMEDYPYGRREYRRDPGSAIPAYLFEMSVRDRARFGLLYLRRGCWAGRQVVPAQWAETSLAPLTKRGDELDYGYLWWSQGPVRSAGMHGRLIMARGNGNQYITLIPEADAVLVLAYDMDHWPWVNWLRNRLRLAPEFEDYQKVLTEVLAARPRQRG
jgi:CubicO group peptidase (beta-lactamase class C family)